MTVSLEFQLKLLCSNFPLSMCKVKHVNRKRDSSLTQYQLYQCVGLTSVVIDLIGKKLSDKDIYTLCINVLHCRLCPMILIT